MLFFLATIGGQKNNLGIRLDEKGFCDWQKPRPEKTLPKVFEGESRHTRREAGSPTGLRRALKIFQ
jgi:hypothetical protein